ncbi:MAG: hypothetical protein AB7D29_05170 [Campylobacterales bacterium]
MKINKILFGLMLFFATLTQIWGDVEPNNACGESEAWSTLGSYGDTSSTLSGAVSTSDNNDYYKLTIGIEGRVDIVVKSTQNADFYLLNSSCTSVASKTNTSNNTISYTAAPGTYYLRIKYRSGWFRASTTNYNSIKATLSFPDENWKDFELIYTKNLSGSVKAIGNSILCKSSKQSSSNYKDGTCVAPGDDEPNNDFYAIYSDVDGDSSTSDSTSAKLTIPTGATIKWAGIYWNGRLGSGKTTAEKLAAKTIKLKIPGALSYATITADTMNWATSNFAYKCYKDITDIVSKTSPNGDYFVSGIKTATGKNAFGAWSIFVVYEKDGETFKNISVYDGFFSIASSTNEALGQFKTKSVDISGFLTPTSGVVNSKLLMFSAEGDMDYQSETLTMTNKSGTEVAISNSLNPANNAFNSNITENGATFTNRNPSYANTVGIDIDTFDVSSIMQNGQKTTTIKFTTTYDQYFPSALAFSTDLYIPDVCYEEDITKGGAPITTTFVGDTLDVNVTITNKNAEAAKKVVVTKTFNQYLGYKQNTTFIKPSGVSSFTAATDTSGDDTVTYDVDTQKLTFNMGTGSTAAVGGTIEQNQVEEFKNQITLLKDGDFTSDYKVSFTDVLGLTDYADIPIMKCSKLPATSLSVSPSGKVRIVENGKNWGDNNDGRLLMKVASTTSYVYDILFATDDSGATLTTGKITKLELINRTNNTVLATPINTLTPINQRMSINVALNNAYKDLQFKITLEDGSQATSNNFSVRPATFDITGTSPIKAGQYITPFYAKSKEEATLNLYSGLATISTTLDVSGRTNCSAGANDTNITSPITFVSGVYGGVDSGTFSNVGNYTIRILDSTWSGVDQFLDCIENSSTNIADGSGRYGCNTELNKEFSVSPFTFIFNNLSLSHSNNGFVYFLKGDAAELNNMNVSLGGGTVTAVGYNSALALTNYTSGCYANPYTLSFNAPIVGGITLANIGHNSNTDFTNGVLTLSSAISPKYNYYVSNYATAVLPMTQTGGTDLNVSIGENIDGGLSVTSGLNFASTANKANFLYGRINMPNTSANAGDTVRVFAEVYATSSSSLPSGTTWVNAPGSTTWWINSLDGTSKINGAIARPSNVLDTTTSQFSITTPATMSVGKVSFTLTGGLNDQQAVIHMDVPTYLWYGSNAYLYSASPSTNCSQHPCGNIEIFGSADKEWYGAGDKKGDKAIQTVPKGKRAPKVNW